MKYAESAQSCWLTLIKDLASLLALVSFGAYPKAASVKPVTVVQGFTAHGVLHTSQEEAEACELRLQGLDSDKEADCYTKLRKSLLEAWPGHLPLLQERVQRMGKAKDKQRTPEQGAEFWEAS